MKHICMFSGGAASAYMSWLVANENDKDNVILLYTPTGGEHTDADRFRKQVADYIGIPIETKSCGMDIWTLIDHNKAIPNFHFPFCTRVLKMEQTERFLKALDDDYILYYGFGPDEWKRVQKATARNEQIGRNVNFPLWEKRITNEQVKEIIKSEWKICLPEPYKYLQHNNCIPCWKGSMKHFKAVLKYYPDEFWKAVEKEEIYGPYTLFSKPLRELAEIWETDDNQISLVELEESIPCMCAL